MVCDEKFIKGMLFGRKVGLVLGMTEAEIRKMWTKCIKADIEYDRRMKDV